MKILRTVLVGMLIFSLGVGASYAAPKKDNPGQGNQGQGNQGQGNQGQGNQGNNGQVRANQVRNAQATSHTSTSEIRKNKIERGKSQANLRANRPEKENHGQAVKANRTANIDHGKSAEHRKVKEAKVHPHDLLNALGKARWSHNPNDERGQGNMGKVDMRDPYGHDKDSGRVGSERGRAIHGPSLEELLVQGELLSLDFTMPDDYFVYRLQQLLEEAIAAGNESRIDFFTFMIHHFTVTNPYPFNWIKPERDESVDFTLTFNADRFEGSTLLITTTIMSATDYDYPYYTAVYDPATNSYKPVLTHTLHYDYGQVIMAQTEEVVLAAENSFSFSYDVPDNIGFGVQLLSDLIVTVTDPASGAIYTTSYNKQLMLARCPYGKVYDKKTGQSIVGAKVTVHFEDGSIVPLDKSTNSTASNPQVTDATGRYGFKLQTNRKYYLTATAPSYKDYKSEVFTEKWHVLREDVALTSIEEKEEQLVLNLK